METIIISGLISAALILFLTPFWIKILKELQVGQKIREAGPQSHMSKEGTPTMGGALFWVVFVLTMLLFFERSPMLIWTIILTAGFSIIGAQDDYFKIKKNESLGLKARQKIFLMFLLSSLAGLYLYLYQPRGSILLVPFTGQEIELGWLIVPFVILVYMASANAVNLTDGLDGLAAGAMGIVLMGFTALSIIHNETMGAIMASSVAGVCFAFLWYNGYPARIIMGDTGSLMLGSFLASLAVFQNFSLYLLLLGGLFVIVTLSVIIQVIYFRLTGGKRIFKMSPLHHHFELSGWAENQVVIRFWIVALLFVIIGIWGAFNGS